MLRERYLLTKKEIAEILTYPKLVKHDHLNLVFRFNNIYIIFKTIYYTIFTSMSLT